MFIVRNDQITALARDLTARALEAELAPFGVRADFDSEANQLLVTDSRGNTTKLALDHRGRIESHLTPLGRRFSFEYDSKGRLAHVTSPAGLRVECTYHEDGALRGVSRSTGDIWGFEWDRWNNLSKTIFPDNSFEEVSSIGPEQISHYTTRSGNCVRFEHDARGNVITIVDPESKKTTFDYDKWDRPDRIKYSDGNCEVIERDPLGRIRASYINGQLWASITYDSGGRIAKVDFADGHFTAFLYSDTGRVIEARNPSSVVKRRYDQADRLVEEEQNGLSVKYGYDARRLLTSVTTPEGETLTFSYDADGRLIGAQDWNGGRHTFTYHDSGRRVRHGFPNELTTVTSLCEDGLPLSIETSFVGSGRQPHYQRFQYDINRRISYVNDSEAGPRHFQYDFDGRLVSVKDESGLITERFEYDKNSNRCAANRESADFNAQNQILCHGSSRVIHDSRGNLIERITTDGSIKFSYNGQNLLRVCQPPKAAHIEYEYDAFARRISKRVGSVRTIYIWAGDQLLCEKTESAGEVFEQRDYMFIPYSHSPLSMRTNGVIFQYHTDHLGTPQFLTDRLGQVAWRASYSAFGRAKISIGTISQALRFPGQYCDDETGLHYNRARYYSPDLGIYMSRDPLELVAGIHFYNYADCDPINGSDALGLFSWKAVVAAAAIVAGAAIVVVAAPVVVGAMIAVAGGAAIAAGTAGAAGCRGSGTYRSRCWLRSRAR
jgi:RHS repeat-associated protein